MRLFAGLLLTTALLAPAPAQTGLQLVRGGSAFVIAGTDCGPFSCTPAFGTVHSTFGAELRVWGMPGGLFAVAASASPPGCVSFIGFGGQLVLTPPILTLAVGALPQGPINSCGQVQAPPIPLPFTTQHAQLSFLFQAVSFLPVPAAQPGSFSSAIQATVRS